MTAVMDLVPAADHLPAAARETLGRAMNLDPSSPDRSNRRRVARPNFHPLTINDDRRFKSGIGIDGFMSETAQSS